VQNFKTKQGDVQMDTKIVVTRQAMWAMLAGEARGYTYLNLGQKGVIEDRVVGLGWYFVPRSMDTAVVPKKADELARPVYEAGVVVLQEIIGHEIKVVEDSDSAGEESTPNRSKLAMGLGIAGLVTVGVVAVASVLAPPAVAVAAAPVAATGTSAWALAGLGALALIDPALILVLEDGTWLQCASWLED
jgi:hypothetical protein